MEEDRELQAYLNELSSDGTGPNGGIGRVSLLLPKKKKLQRPILSERILIAKIFSHYPPYRLIRHFQAITLRGNLDCVGICPEIKEINASKVSQRFILTLFQRPL